MMGLKEESWRTSCIWHRIQALFFLVFDCPMTNGYHRKYWPYPGPRTRGSSHRENIIWSSKGHANASTGKNIPVEIGTIGEIRDGRYIERISVPARKEIDIVGGLRGRHDTVQESEDVQREVPLFVQGPEDGDGSGGRVHRKSQEESRLRSGQVLLQKTGTRAHRILIQFTNK